MSAHGRSPLTALLALAAVLGMPVVGPAAASSDAQQTEQRARPELKVRSMTELPGRYTSPRSLALGRAPWVDRHGYLLRQVRRPMSRGAR